MPDKKTTSSISEVNGDLIDELDDRYHEKKLLDKGAEVPAKITQANIEDDDNLQLKLETKYRELTIGIFPTVKNIIALNRLHQQLNLKFKKNIGQLIGKSVIISLVDNGSRVSIEGIDRDFPIVDHMSIPNPNRLVFNEDYPTALSRIRQYGSRAIEDRAKKEYKTPHVAVAPIINTYAPTTEEFYVEIDLFGEFEILEFTPSDDSVRWTRLIETVGGGSPKQIDGDLYTIRAGSRDNNDASSLNKNIITTVRDGLSEWWVFGQKEDAEFAAENLTKVILDWEKDVDPSEADAELSNLQFDSLQNVPTTFRAYQAAKLISLIIFLLVIILTIVGLEGIISILGLLFWPSVIIWVLLSIAKPWDE